MHSSFTSAQTVVLCEKKGYYPCEGYLDTFSSKSTVNFFTGVLAAARVCSWQHFTYTYHLLTSSVAITVGCAKNNPVRGCFEVFSRAPFGGSQFVVPNEHILTVQVVLCTDVCLLRLRDSFTKPPTTNILTYKTKG